MGNAFDNLLRAGSTPDSSLDASKDSNEGRDVAPSNSVSLRVDKGRAAPRDAPEDSTVDSEVQDARLLNAHVEATPEEFSDPVEPETQFVSSDEVFNGDTMDDDEYDEMNPELDPTPLPTSGNYDPIDPNSVTPVWGSVTGNSRGGGAFDMDPSGEELLESSAREVLANPFDDDIPRKKSRGKPAHERASGLVASFFEAHPGIKRPAMFAAAGLTVALISSFIFGDSPASETPIADSPVYDEESVDTADEPQDTILFPSQVSASCPGGGTRAALAFSGKAEEAWVCPRAHGIEGATMNMIFSRSVTIRDLCVVPGWNYVAPNGKDHWNEHRIVTQILWRIGGQRFSQPINPIRSEACLHLPGDGVTTTVMSLTIQKSVIPNSTSVDTLPGSDGEMLPELPGLEPPSSDGEEGDSSTAIGLIKIKGIER